MILKDFLLRVSNKIFPRKEQLFVTLDLINGSLADKTSCIASSDCPCRVCVRIEAVMSNPWPVELMSAIRESFRKNLILKLHIPL